MPTVWHPNTFLTFDPAEESIVKIPSAYCFSVPLRMFHAQRIKYALIVMPVSLLENWCMEFEKWCVSFVTRRKAVLQC